MAGHMLPPQDRTAVSSQISVLDQSLAQLEATESKLAGALEATRTEIFEVRKQRAALESRIAAVWSLPPEILAYIFEIGALADEEERAAATTAEDDSGDGDGATDDDPDGDAGAPGDLGFHVLVSHVCCMFREVALHTPALWTRIRISDLDAPRLEYVRACVERSGCAALDVLVDCDEDLKSDPAPFHALMALLVPHISRFKRLTVRLCGFRPLYLIMQHLEHPAPQLEVLELSDIDYENAFDEEDPFEPPTLREPLTLFGGVMPKLECLSLDGAHVAWAKCNFSCLSDLQLGYHTRDVRPTYDEFKAIIDASPNLHTLHLRGSAPLLSYETTDTTSYPPLHMERLEDLHISDIPSEYATILISLLNAPHLQSLSLTDLDTNDYSGFLRRIIGPPALFPALNTLKLAAIEVSDDAFEDFLRAHSKITHLGLYFGNTKLSYLEPRGPENEVLCPKLECLRCVSASTVDIKELLEKRREAGFAIPTLQIDKETASWDGKGYMKWIKENAAVEIIEPSEHGTDDSGGEDESDSDWATEEDEEDEIGLPFIAMEGFSDEDAEDEDFDDASDMEVDASDDSFSDGE